MVSSLMFIEDAKCFSFADFFTLVSRLKFLSESECLELRNKSLAMIVSVDGKKGILSISGRDIVRMYIRSVAINIAQGTGIEIKQRDSILITKLEQEFKVKRRVVFHKADLLPCGNENDITEPISLGSGLISCNLDQNSGFVYLFNKN
jgi:hypothetical protein